MKHLKAILFLFFIVQISFTQNDNRIFRDLEVMDNHLEVHVNDGKYVIQFYTSEIVETTFIPIGEDSKTKSHAVILAPNNVEGISIATNSGFLYSTDGISVSIQKQPFQISYSYKGKPIISEKGGYIKNDSLETIQFNLSKDEVLYGGGARALGMNRRGNRLQLYNRAHYGYEERSELMNFTMPIVISSKQYLIHFDNAPIGFLDLDSKQDNTLTYETISGRKTYQVVVGDSWLDLIDNYTDLTGKQPLPPRWAFGNFSSRFGYHSQKEVMRTIDKFKEDQIPLDAIILDIYWFGKEVKGTMGNLEFYRDSFPDPAKMIKDLKSKNVETILITEPFVLTTSNRWQEAVQAGVLAKDSIGNPFTYDFFFGNTGLIDIYSSNGERWFKSIYQGLLQEGVTGMWGDLGEPEVHPSKLIHAIGTADEVHNIYGHDWARLVAEAYHEFNSNTRPFILMRAGYSGSQRFGMIPWSGDVNRTWGGLSPQPEIAIQMALQGLAYMHSDLGGFAGANLDDELYTRWLQYGVFQPIFRPHAQEDVASEPIFRSEKAKALAKQTIELRYKLLPYNYTLAFQNNQTGAPFMRPVFFEQPDDKTLQERSSEYLWGNDFLVAPVLRTSVVEQDVYFPKHSNWFDFYTDEKIGGGQTKSVQVRENSIPTFVRAGAFIPMGKPMQSTKEYNGNSFVLHYYFDRSVKESKGKLYNDDGLTAKAFEKGQYEMLHFESELEGKVLELEFESNTGINFSPSVKSIEVIVHNIHEQPKRVKVDRKIVDVNYNETYKTLSIPIQWNTTEDLEIKIQFKK